MERPAGSYPLRRAMPSDYDRIASVVESWWGRPVGPALPRLFLDHFFETSLVAERGDELAGFLVGLLSPGQPEVAYVHFVGVHPRARRAGLAQQLYLRFFDMARADGRSLVRAITSPRNTASIAFHQALGFTVSAPIAGYDGPSRDRVVFQRRLHP